MIQVSDISLRQWDANELVEYAHIDSVLFTKQFARGVHDFCAHVNSQRYQGGAVSIVYHGETIGFVLYSLRKVKFPVRYWEIHDVTIHPAFQRRGYGTEALQQITDQAIHYLIGPDITKRKDDSVMRDRLRACVPESNLGLQLWLKKAGWKVPANGIRYDVYGEGKNGYMFTKRR